MKVLIVDDSKAMRLIVGRTLKQAGLPDLTVVEATNGAEALEKIESSAPDFVLSDWNMPEMNGIDLLREVRKRGHAVKFAFVTSESSPETHATAIEAGAAFVVTKPFTPETLQEAFEKAA